MAEQKKIYNNSTQSKDFNVDVWRKKKKKRIKHLKHLKTMKSHYSLFICDRFRFLLRIRNVNVFFFWINSYKRTAEHISHTRMKSKWPSSCFGFQCQPTQKMMNSLINICDGHKMFSHFFFRNFNECLVGDDKAKKTTDNRQFIIFFFFIFLWRNAFGFIS